MIISEREHHIATLLRNGDGRVAKELYDAYSGYITGVCARYLSDNDDLKDVVQECFIKIFTSQKSFNYNGPGSLKAWLTKIAVNQALKYLRDNHRADFMQLTGEEPAAVDEQPDLDGISEDEIMQMIRELPTGYRTIFNLYVFEEKTHKEIAKLLNIKENSSASQFHRAKCMLANKIKGYAQHEDTITYRR